MRLVRGSLTAIIMQIVASTSGKKVMQCEGCLICVDHRRVLSIAAILRVGLRIQYVEGLSHVGDRRIKLPLNGQ